MASQAKTSVLFSDIRDFTEFTAAKGDAQALELLKTHHRIAQETIEHHQGQLLKTYGDGLMSRFDQPIQAIKASVMLQHRFNDYTQQHPHMPLLVGMGIHFGEVLEEQGDLFGLAVNLAKRLADEARSGQIIVSDAVLKQLPLEEVPWRCVKLEDRALKGVGPMALYEVIWRHEAMRLTTKNHVLNLVLTQNDKLVIELGKHVRGELEALKGKLKAKAGDEDSGLIGWLADKGERWLPDLIDKTLLKLGIGIEHSLDQVSFTFEDPPSQRLSLKIGQKRFDLDGSLLKGFDPAELERFIAKVHERQGTLHAPRVAQRRAKEDRGPATAQGTSPLPADLMPGVLLKKLLITLSKNEQAKQTFTSWGPSKKLVRRFVAGERVEEAIEAIRELNRHDIFATLDHLGEETLKAEDAAQAVEEYVHLLDALCASGVQSTASLKLTQLGLAIDPAQCERNLGRLLEQAAACKKSICIDMEGSAYTQRTLELFTRLRAHHDNVHIAVQANLRRTADDLEKLIQLGASVRVVKGAYLEPVSVAFQQKREVDRQFARLVERVLSKEAQDRGAYVAIATHDEILLRWACSYIQEQKIPQSGYEFQMLFGIRQDLQRQLAEAGHLVRVYVSYGTQWYPYFMRRLAERPANVFFLLKNLMRS